MCQPMTGNSYDRATWWTTLSDRFKKCGHYCYAHLEQEDSKLSVLELLPGKEPGCHCRHQHPDDGGRIGGDVGGHIGVGHSQVRKRLINKLNICEIGLTTLKTL